MKLISPIFLISLLLVAGCKQADSDYTLANPTMVELLLDSVVVTKMQLFADPMVKHYYHENNYQLTWTKNNNFIKPADSLLHIIRGASRYGLVTHEYHYDDIEKLLALPADEVTRSRIDVLLTDAFFTFYHHLKHGRINTKSFVRLKRIRQMDSVAIENLHEAIRKNRIREVLERQEPEHWAYENLRSVARELLASLNDTTGIMQPSSSKKSFTDEQLKKVFVNLERWRWEDNDWPERYLLVNIPSYMLYVVENDEVVMESKVIVGDRGHTTPVLSSVIDCFVTYPYWHVPKSIATKELLPKIKEDKNYLRRNNFQVLDQEWNVVDESKIKWNKVDEEDFPYLLRQREGLENSLGVIKFVFENPYGVYLHDTNSPRLFNSSYRALSHGCVRVERAHELAYYLAGEDDSAIEKLEQCLNDRKRREFNIEPIPVYIRYFTTDTFRDSTAFHTDIYNYDGKLIRAFNLSRKRL